MQKIYLVFLFSIPLFGSAVKEDVLSEVQMAFENTSLPGSIKKEALGNLSQIFKDVNLSGNREQVADFEVKKLEDEQFLILKTPAGGIGYNKKNNIVVSVTTDKQGKESISGFSVFRAGVIYFLIDENSQFVWLPVNPNWIADYKQNPTLLLSVLNSIYVTLTPLLWMPPAIKENKIQSSSSIVGHFKRGIPLLLCEDSKNKGFNCKIKFKKSSNKKNKTIDMKYRSTEADRQVYEGEKGFVTSYIKENCEFHRTSSEKIKIFNTISKIAPFLEIKNKNLPQKKDKYLKFCDSLLKTLRRL